MGGITGKMGSFFCKSLSYSIYENLYFLFFIIALFAFYKLLSYCKEDNS